MSVRRFAGLLCITFAILAGVYAFGAVKAQSEESDPSRLSVSYALVHFAPSVLFLLAGVGLLSEDRPRRSRTDPSFVPPAPRKQAATVIPESVERRTVPRAPDRPMAPCPRCNAANEPSSTVCRACGSSMAVGSEVSSSSAQIADPGRNGAAVRTNGRPVAPHAPTRRPAPPPPVETVEPPIVVAAPPPPVETVEPPIVVAAPPAAAPPPQIEMVETVETVEPPIEVALPAAAPPPQIEMVETVEPPPAADAPSRPVGPRYFKRRWDPEGGDVWGASDWYFEADADGRVTRQATVYDRGDRVLKYDAVHRSDAFGMLEDLPLDFDEFAPFEIAQSAFEDAWDKQPPSPPPAAKLPVRHDVFDDPPGLATRYLGTIHQLSGMSARERTLAIFDSAIVEARGSDLAAIGRLGGPVGAELMRNKAKRRADEDYADADPRALADADSGNRLISIDAVTHATLSKTKVGLYRELALTLSDGSTVTYSWQPAHNGDDATVPLLWSALGPRLTSSF